MSRWLEASSNQGLIICSHMNQNEITLQSIITNLIISISN